MRSRIRHAALALAALTSPAAGQDEEVPLIDATEVVLDDDPYLSPRHARLSIRDGAFVLRDLESVNKPYPSHVSRARRSSRVVVGWVLWFAFGLLMGMMLGAF